jgi:hypothetical protein
LNRIRTSSLANSMTITNLAIPARAANESRAGKMEKTGLVWTNQDLKDADLEDWSPSSVRPHLYMTQLLLHCLRPT